MNINNIIKYPILTEKTYGQMQENVYTFAVDKRASKIEIKRAVEFIFDVKVESVNTFNVPKKAKRVGRYEGFTKSYKKAIVKLNEGSIVIFPEEGIANDEKLKEEKEKEVKAIEKAKEISALEDKVAKKLQKSKEKKVEPSTSEKKTITKKTSSTTKKKTQKEKEE